MIDIINQLFEIERKSIENEIHILERNLTRIKYEFEQLGYIIENPIHKKFDERDTSIEAKIMNENSTLITKVLKPIIYTNNDGQLKIVQKGIVIVE
ncbi:hypothetical protein [Flavobacterium urocaniciphilum]|uniref:Uncharacterized protein n=1 Tax=Flavobacterium urocaniciphilum TaxID=1299341 RepID=A0A1H9CXF4_9FLAO|nr:hypothetical protein [Flavobacterium urocaniciphilum]SEQ05821.1 hypothetical protein SAMN05444005_105138 [Flavobacterium urocaniciphilum]